MYKIESPNNYIVNFDNYNTTDVYISQNWAKSYLVNSAEKTELEKQIADLKSQISDKEDELDDKKAQAYKATGQNIGDVDETGSVYTPVTSVVYPVSSIVTDRNFWSATSPVFTQLRQHYSPARYYNEYTLTEVTNDFVIISGSISNYTITQALYGSVWTYFYKESYTAPMESTKYRVKCIVFGGNNTTLINPGPRGSNIYLSALIKYV